MFSGTERGKILRFEVICYTVEPRLTTTSLLRPYSFKPKVKNIDSFYYFQDPVNATTSLLRPGFYGPTVVVLTGSTVYLEILKLEIH